MIATLTADEILSIHWQLVDLFRTQGDPIWPAGPRDTNLLHSAVSRPATSLGKQDKYPGVEAKAAALFHSLVMDHPFHNGNKRTALVSLLVSLDRNDRRVTATDDELFAFVLGVAARSGVFAGSADEVVAAIEAWIDSNCIVTRLQASGMRTLDFLKCCEKAGASFRKTGRGQSWLIIGPNRKSIKLAGSTQQLTGVVVKRYLAILGLSEGVTGVHLDEFQEGLEPNQRLMRQFRTVLKRLARA
jgi:death on curing protein